MAKGNSADPTKGPLGGIFGFIGIFVGAFYGTLIGEWPVGILGAFIGAWTGYVIEHVVYRVLLVALVIIFIFARQAFFHAIFDHAMVMPVEVDHAAYVYVIEKQERNDV